MIYHEILFDYYQGSYRGNGKYAAIRETCTYFGSARSK